MDTMEATVTQSVRFHFMDVYVFHNATVVPATVIMLASTLKLMSTSTGKLSSTSTDI